MSHPAALAWLASQRKRIAGIVEAGAPFIEVERVIADSALAPDQKTELWTMAWSLLGPERQRQHAQWITEATYSGNPPRSRSSDRPA
jgi:hypothetical protein